MEINIFISFFISHITINGICLILGAAHFSKVGIRVDTVTPVSCSTLIFTESQLLSASTHFCKDNASKRNTA